MIDVHCHLLPGIDDGPRSMDESIELARLAVKNGITHAIVTPHIHPGRWENDRLGIERLTQQFQQRLAAADIPLAIGMAAEVRLDADIVEWVTQNRIPFLGMHNNKRVLLLELPHSHIPAGAENLTAWLLQRDILPLIAHPERNRDVIRKLDKIRPLIEQGCLLQLTAGAVAGHFGKPAQQRARQLLEMGAVFALASDAHNRDRRPPDLACGLDAATTIVGPDIAQQLVTTNPYNLVSKQFDIA